MPRRVRWELKAADVEAVEADEMVAQMPAFDIDKSQTMACTRCKDAEHKMRYRLLLCSSEACSDASDVKCAWRGKMVTCLESQHVSIFEYGDHNSEVSTPPTRKKLSATQKAVCRELAENHLRPMRIRHALARKFATPLEELPTLKTVQNFVNHHGRTEMQNHDRVAELRSWIHECAYDGSELMNQVFTFTWELDDTGKPVIGNGSDEKPFLVGLSTKALMLRLIVPPDSFILHVDATYKLSQCGYPVLVVGVSDRSRKFHLVALFIISQETQPVLQSALLSLRRTYSWITQKQLVVRFAMADGDKAQSNALAAMFGDNPAYCFLMCFFHVMKKVQEHLKPLSSLAQAAILRDIYDLHFARCHSVVLQMLDASARRWVQDPEMVPFARYVIAQWMTGTFTRWQAYHTPTGFATTNNRCETFNAVLKRDYTLRRWLKVGSLLRELASCCQDQSGSVRAFEFVVLPPDTLIRRVSELMRLKLLGLAEGENVDESTAGSRTTVQVVSLRAPRVIMAPNMRSEEAIAVTSQMGVNYSRMEVEGQPWSGWTVDVERQWCPCNY
uniref:MULE transposase domain-containing protein n=1 Tax=Phytophthora ramorum TaxID=164328 RepID=H3GHY2_PHYRM